ncbi:MAG: LysM peptidoglycan-binding domain-containing protein [Chlamydiota bacterium]
MRSTKPLLLFVLGAVTSCTPLTSSPDEEKHQAELTLHEIQTNVDDLRHDLNRFQTELSISDDKMRHQEKSLSSLKDTEWKSLTQSLQQLSQTVEEHHQEITRLRIEAKETKAMLDNLSLQGQNRARALVQYKGRLEEMTSEMRGQSDRLQELITVKELLHKLSAKVHGSAPCVPYMVKAGDTLESIAQVHGISVEQILQMNRPEQTIAIGQEILLPLAP